MSDFTSQFFGDAKKLTLTTKEHAQVFTALKAHTKVKALSSLSQDEKAEVLGNLVLHMRRHPITSRRNVFSTVYNYFSLHRLTAGVLTVALLSSISGGVTYAAEHAMPDSLLYQVKLHINEPLITAFQTTPEKKAQWEMKRVQRRLREAEHIAKNEQLHERHEQVIRTRLEKRIEHLSSALDKVPVDQQLEIAERIDSELQKHQQFLEAIETGNLPPPTEMRKFRQGIGDVQQRFRGKHLPPPGLRNTETKNQVEITPKLPDFSSSGSVIDTQLPRLPNKMERPKDILKTHNRSSSKQILRQQPSSLRLQQPDIPFSATPPRQ